MTFYIKTFNLTNFQSGVLPFGSDPDPVLAQKLNLGSQPSKKLEIFNFEVFGTTPLWKLVRMSVCM